jgi:hypothetical protein
LLQIYQHALQPPHAAPHDLRQPHHALR